MKEEEGKPQLLRFPPILKIQAMSKYVSAHRVVLKITQILTVESGLRTLERSGTKFNDDRISLNPFHNNKKKNLRDTISQHTLHMPPFHPSSVILCNISIIHS